MSTDVVVEREREAVEAPTHAEVVTPVVPDADAGLSELERHKKARGYGQPPKLPTTPNAKSTKPSVSAAPEPKANPGAGTETPAAETTPETTPGETPALDAKDQIVDPDTHERYDGRTKAGKRVRQLLNDRAQLRDGVQALRQEVETLRRQVAEGSTGRAPQNPQQTASQAAPAANGEDPEPQLAQFQSYDEYSRATARWVTRQELRSAREADRASGEQARQREQFQQQASAFQEKTPVMQEKYPDYLEVIGRVPMGPQFQHITRTILSSPVGPELSYYLGSHPEAMQALMQAPTLDAHLRLLGRYEHEVESALKGAPARVATSRAPAPVSPVATSGSSSVGGKKPGEMNLQEFRNARGYGPSFNRH